MAILERLRNIQFRLTRRLLSAWIRPTILGCDRDTLGISASDPVCYVLPFRSIADLMVIDKACEDAGCPKPTDAIPSLDEKRAIFFLGHPEGRFGRKTQRQQSERMLRLVDNQQGLDETIKLVPVSLFWGHQPEQEKSLVKLLLSENWTVTSRFKKLLAIVFHPNHILVQFSRPINLKDLITDGSDQEKQIRKLLRILRVHFNHQKQAILGPDLSHRRTLINTIISSKEVQSTILRESEKKDLSAAEIEKKAIAYANEIASHQSYRVIRFFHVLLSWLWNNLYDGINVNHIDRVKNLAQSHEIIYTPCHRSHIDYLLLSYVLYHNGLTPPHIAAGKNLNLPVIGTLLRRAGAFYMRRSFQGDTLYKAVFDEYLHQMFIKGYSVEYFIEGGRSRTGRTLNPRTGMLNMTLNSFQKDSSMPICLMPVYFGYERVLESSTYMNELAGRSKKTESVFDIFKIFNSFKYSFGQVTVNFGEPLLLDKFLDAELPDWASADNNTGLSKACSNLATELVTRINSAVAINEVSLVATAILSTPRQTIEEQHLLHQISLLAEIARSLAYSDDYSVTDLPATGILDMAATISGISRNEHPFGTTISATPQQAIHLTYYRNNISHIFALPSLIARFIKVKRQVSVDDICQFCSLLYPYLKAEFKLRWPSRELQDLCERIIDIFNHHGLIFRDGDQVKTTADNSNEFTSLREMAEIIEPTLERFHIVNALLATGSSRSVKALESDAAAIAQQLSAIYGINSPDFFERSLFSTFINSLKAQGMVATNDGHVESGDHFSDLADATAMTLDADVQYNVLQAVPKDF